ncbi:hypothetical protein IV203_028436 [Nitzschia inconspicua]|uniref:Uncharacterized protein n=1 Tax=Nitzschia inconspicua TaxID=303405 RepID=A0A9K3LRT3_9STRA|nr:hypothetical protein IV203_028436 [Nitzschia inconspicua]
MPGHLVGFVFELVVLSCSVAAIVTNSLLLTNCQLLNLSFGQIKVGSLGLYNANFPVTSDLNEFSNGNCIRIDDIPNIDSYKDAAFNCARVGAVIAFVFGAIMFVFGFFKQCLRPLPCTQRIMDVCGGLGQLFLGLVYVVWLTEACDQYQCTFGTGGTYLILTQVFWMASASFTRCMRPGRYERRDEIQAQRAAKEEKKEKEREEA